MLKPLFRWAGGKTKHLKYLSQHLKIVDCYVEPFFGGGAVFCYMVNNNMANRFIINDIKVELAKLYSDVALDLDSTLETVLLIQDQYLSLSSKPERKKFYYQQRQEYWNNPSSGLLFFLLKTCFNGIWQTCRDSNGMFGTPCGLLSEKGPFIDQYLLKEWSEVLQRTTIMSDDFENLTVPNNSLVYCDPPYRDSFTTYGTEFDDNDQIRCVNWCEKVNIETGSKVVLSNKSDGVFFENLENKDISYYDTTHTAGRRKITVEDDKSLTYMALKAREMIIVWDT